MNKMTLELRKFVNDLYKVDLDEMFDISNGNWWIDDSWITVDTDELLDVASIVDVNPLDDDEMDRLRKAIKIAKSRSYETTFIDECYGVALKWIEDKIKDDFEKLNHFFDGYNDGLYDDENDAKLFKEGEVKVTSIDWSEDTITFEGDMRKFLGYVIACCNGYGMFRFDSIKDMEESYYGDDTKRNILSHMHWLKKLEEIYGTTQNFFSIDLSDVDRYASGSTEDYTIEDVKEELAWV